ncbi:MAG: response regulator transcription factor [Vicinamibacterales bacterium]
MPPSSAPHVLFVEPAGAQTDHLRQLLTFEGIGVAECGADGLHEGVVPCPQLVVLNHARLRRATLVLAQAVARWRHPPLTLALVAQGDELRGVELVERGVDSFLTLPCGSREFVARVRALLRRVPTAPPPAQAGAVDSRAVRVRHLDIDPARRRVRVGDSELRLTEQEFQLLYFLAGHPGRVFDRQSLLDAVWGSGTFVTVRSVDALVKRLRHQLRPVLEDACVVETVRGVGYRLSDGPAGSGVTAA